MALSTLRMTRKLLGIAATAALAAALAPALPGDIVAEARSEEAPATRTIPLAPDAPARYVVQRGDVVVRGERHPGLTTLSAFDCGDSRLRLGIWTGPDPGDDGLAGSLADEAAIAAFLSHLHPCRS